MLARTSSSRKLGRCSRHHHPSQRKRARKEFEMNVFQPRSGEPSRRSSTTAHVAVPPSIARWDAKALEINAMQEAPVRGMWEGAMHGMATTELTQRQPAFQSQQVKGIGSLTGARRWGNNTNGLHGRMFVRMFLLWLRWLPFSLSLFTGKTGITEAVHLQGSQFCLRLTANLVSSTHLLGSR